MNWVDFLIICALGAALFFAGRTVYRAKKYGGCVGCSCKGCSCNRSGDCAGFGDPIETTKGIVSSSDTVVKNLSSGVDHPEVR